LELVKQKPHSSLSPPLIKQETSSLQSLRKKNLKKYIEDMTGRFGDIKVYFREVKKTEYFANKRSLLKEIKDKYNDIVD